MTRILGISAFYHDSAACLVQEGQIVAACQEERFSRRKHDARFPKRAVQACLQLGGCRVKELQAVVFYEKPFLKFERLLETYLQNCPKGLTSYLKAIPGWVKEKLWIKEEIRRRLDYQGEILFADHHESHAASAFYPSPFPRAAILTLDGVGEWTTTALGRGEGNQVELFADLHFPHSLGLLYSAFTYYLGFRVNSGEYKVMGLAPYGQPRYADLIRKELVEVGADGSFTLNRRYFNYETGLTMISRHFQELFGGPPRTPREPLQQKHMDLAASIQKVTEEIVLGCARHLRRLSGEQYLCLAGGVALNCVANGRILRELDYQDIWIQPAAGDAGGSLGAALLIWHRYLNRERQGVPGEDSQQGSLLGTAYSPAQIRRFLEQVAAPHRELPDTELLPLVARLLAEGSIVGWFQGRMEFGPRALGNRSILADPRHPQARQRVNLQIKFRESFRPFAPAVLEEHCSDYFQLDRPSPYMLLVAPVHPQRRHQIPAVTHVDGSARVQTVSAAVNPRFHALLRAFQERTGCPLLLNTSFNVRGEPIVESPRDAFRCFMRTGLDALVMENFLLLKQDQPTGLE